MAQARLSSLRRPGAKAPSPASMAYWASRMRWARHLAEEFLDHVLAAARTDDEAGAVGMMEHPGPPGLLSDPRAGFVRSEDGAGEQPDADQARLPGERLPAVVEHVAQPTFADVEADEVGEQARQPR